MFLLFFFFLSNIKSLLLVHLVNKSIEDGLGVKNNINKCVSYTNKSKNKNTKIIMDFDICHLELQ